MNADTHIGCILRATVVGAGAIGGLIAAFIARAGHEVSALDRCKTLNAIREHEDFIVSALECRARE